MFKVLWKFSRKFRGKFGELGNIDLSGFLGEPPEASENIKRITRKIKENLQIIEIFHELFANSYLK